MYIIYFIILKSENNSEKKIKSEHKLFKEKNNYF